MPASQPQRHHQSEPRDSQLATGPRSAWAARWQVGREQHCLSRNATKRHDLAIFASHFRDRVHLFKKRATWSTAYINETKTPTGFLSHKCPCPRGKIPCCPGVCHSPVSPAPFLKREVRRCIGAPAAHEKPVGPFCGTCLFFAAPGGLRIGRVQFTIIIIISSSATFEAGCTLKENLDFSSGLNQRDEDRPAFWFIGSSTEARTKTRAGGML